MIVKRIIYLFFSSQIFMKSFKRLSKLLRKYNRFYNLFYIYVRCVALHGTLSRVLYTEDVFSLDIMLHTMLTVTKISTKSQTSL